MMTFWGMFLLAYVAGSINFAILFLKLAAKRAIQGARRNKNPRKAATPLPPRNPWKQG